MLDLAMKPEEAFSAPLNTTKLAPVTVRINRPPNKSIKDITLENYSNSSLSFCLKLMMSMKNTHLCESSPACCWPVSDSFPPHFGDTPGESQPGGWNWLRCWWHVRWMNSLPSASVKTKASQLQVCRCTFCVVSTSPRWKLVGRGDMSCRNVKLSHFAEATFGDIDVAVAHLHVDPQALNYW